MGQPPGHVIRLHEPIIEAQRVEFRWEVVPPTSLYTEDCFVFEVEAALDFRRVPPWLWWRIGLIALHTHWTLLRPCRLELPIALDPGERETWERLLAAESTTIDAYRGTPSGGAVTIVEGGERPAMSPSLTVAPGRFATAFSGGKDSMLQVGLLAELTRRPLLVSLTSDLPLQQDHSTSRRRFVLDEIRRRRDVELVEVHSAIRATYDQEFARRRGFPISVNELSDGAVYLAATLAVAAARGASQVCIASEIENEAIGELNGDLVQCIYLGDVPILGAISEILAPAGMSASSLISPLRSTHVQQLLWQRYPDIADLQYSCWLVREPDAACGDCEKCARVALRMLGQGFDPALVGIDMNRIVAWVERWVPENIDAPNSPLPTVQIAKDLDRDLARLVVSVPPRAFRLVGRSLAARLARQALRFRRWRGPMPGYWREYEQFLPPALRGSVAQIYAATFPAACDGGGAVSAGRAARLVARILRPQE